MLQLTRTKEIADKIELLLIFISMPGGSKTVMSKILVLLLQSLKHGVNQKRFVRLGMSDVIREERGDVTSNLRPLILGEEPTTLKVGKLLSSPLTVRILDKHIVLNFWHGGRIMLLDGFPRDVQQGEATLDTQIPRKVIYLRVDDENLSFKRIAERAIKEGRFDDAKPERVRERLDVYRDETTHALTQLTTADPASVNEVSAALEFEDRVEAVILAAGYDASETAEMMAELRKPGTPANNLMRETLGLPKAKSRIGAQPRGPYIVHVTKVIA